MDCTPSIVPLVILKLLDFHGLLIMSTLHISDGHGIESMAVQVPFSQAVSDKIIRCSDCFYFTAGKVLTKRKFTCRIIEKI